MNEKPIMVIPAAGYGKRFEQMGYKRLKPFIKINKRVVKNKEIVNNGLVMIELVLNNLRDLASKIYVIVRKDTLEEYSEDIKKLCFKFNVFNGSFLNFITVDNPTEGAACTILTAEKFIDNEQGLVIANSDQWLEFSSSHLVDYWSRCNADGLILTFPAWSKKWSFVKINEFNGLIDCVAEKEPISSFGTVGVYFWRHGSDFVKFAKSMIRDNVRVNNEFYVCPVFNWAIKSGLRVKGYPVVEMWSLGTPEDVDLFCKNFKEYQFIK